MSAIGVIVKKVVFHFKPHFEEYVALIIAKTWGEKIWIGIKDATIYCRDGSKKLRYSAEEHLKRWGNLLIGLGNGPFDEHRDDVKGKCSADLVAEYLQIDRDPKVRIILKGARRGDVKKNNTPLDFGQCVQILTDAGHQPKTILNWLETFFSLYLNERTILKGRETAGQDCIVFPVNESAARNLSQLEERWLKEKGLKPFSELTQFLTGQIGSLAKQPPSFLIDLAEGVALINAYHPNDDSAYRWVCTLFDAALKQQTEFYEALAIAKRARVYKFPDNHNGKYHKLLMIGRWINKSDNTQLVKAVRFACQETDLLMTQRPSGQVGIFSIRLNSHNPLPMILRVLRIEEEIASGITDPDKLTLDYRLAGQDRKISGPSDCWYYFVSDSRMPVGIFNGSFTQSGVGPTKIPFDTIRRIILTMAGQDDNPHIWSMWVKRRLELLQHDRPLTFLLKE